MKACAICKTPLPESEPGTRGRKKMYCGHSCACAAYRKRKFEEELRELEQARTNLLHAARIDTPGF